MDPTIHYRQKQKAMVCLNSNSIKTIHLNNNRIWKNTRVIIQDLCSAKLKIVGLDSLQNLSIKGNYIGLPSLNVSINFPEIRTININGNAVYDDIDICSENTLRSLEVLHYSRAFVQGFSKLDITKCKSLREIYLAHNNLINNFSIAFGANHNLTQLDLSFNSMTLLGKSFREQYERNDMNKHLSIDMKGNPLTCGCDRESKDFVAWLEEHRDTLQPMGETIF